MASRLLLSCQGMAGKTVVATGAGRARAAAARQLHDSATRAALMSPSAGTRLAAAARQFHGSATRAALLQISDREDFHERVILSPIPVIVNFHAEWCEPCKDLTPMLERLVEPKRNLNLCSLDIENHVDLLQDFEVQAVPAVLAFFNGQVVEKFVGLVNEQIVNDFVSRVIGRLNTYSDLQEAQKEPSGDS